MEMIDKHKVDHLETSTAAIDGSAGKTKIIVVRVINVLAEVLCRFSSRVRSLKIHQQIELGIDRSDRYFLGVKDFNWVPVIQEMFKKKLETLEINNIWYPEYLSNSCIDAIGKVRGFPEF